SDDWEFLVSGAYTRNGRYRKRGVSLVTYDSLFQSWNGPINVRIPAYSKKDKGLISSAFLSASGNVIVLAFSQTWQSTVTRELWFSLKKANDKWGRPKKSNNKLARSAFRSIENPFLADDDSTLFYSASLLYDQNEYQNDIYRSYRLDNSFKKWSDPKKVNDTINTSRWENFYKQYDENNWAIYSSASYGKDANIITAKIREKWPYVDMSGVVLLEGSPMRDTFQIVINDQVVDSVRIDRKHSTYAVQLPFGQTYDIRAQSGKREAKVESIDATQVYEYIKLDRDLHLASLPFLDLTGYVRVNGYALQEPFTVIINGTEVDSVLTDLSTGQYTVRLPLGQAYELYAKSGNYIPKTSFVDVSATVQQIQIRKDLDMTAIPFVLIEGQLINQKTNEPISQDAFPKLVLNGEIVDSISTETGTYKIRLPWGQKYTLQVQATEFDPEVATIDLFAVKNYQEIRKNLYASPMELYATITGTVLDKKTNLPIQADYVINVDNSRSTTSTVDATYSTYETRLSLGKKSVLTASADGYFPISEVIDLTSETGNVKLLKDLYLVPLKVGESILLNNIFFESGSSNLKEGSFDDIDRVVDLMRLLPGLKIEIAGHTDSSGNDNLNMQLSKVRAESVVQYIIAQGIDASRVAFKGYGETQPVASNLTPEGRMQNRRVEFIVLEQ
ncbi:MAG: OmpA family protein, partial [Cyclobacteriaceae bacterium]|nr:OmpA family protein [Cyclobacteriaceae bacterium]